MTIIEDKLPQLQEELKGEEQLSDLFYSIHDKLEKGLNYDDIFKQCFIIDDKQGVIMHRHISHVMSLIRDYTTQGRMFYPYFEKRWLRVNTPDVMTKLGHWEVSNQLSNRIINSLSRLIVELNNTTISTDDDKHMELAESISKIKIYQNIISKYIDHLMNSDSSRLSTIVEKFEHYYTIKLNDILDLEQVERQLKEIEYL